MKIVITIQELMERHVWLDFCMLTGYNEWAVNEGLANGDDEVTLTFTDAVTLGLVAP